MQEILLKIRYFEKGLSKSLKKVNFIIFLNRNRKRFFYQKQKGPGTSDQLVFRLLIKFRKIPLLAIYYLNKFDDVI